MINMSNISQGNIGKDRVHLMVNSKMKSERMQNIILIPFGMNTLVIESNIPKATMYSNTKLIFNSRFDIISLHSFIALTPNTPTFCECLLLLIFVYFHIFPKTLVCDILYCHKEHKHIFIF